MGKLSVFLVIAILCVLALFAVYNNETTVVNVPFDKPYEILKVGLILLSGVFGALVMLGVFVIRDTRHFLRNYRVQRRRKKEDKVESLYGKAVNAILAGDEAGAMTLLEGILELEPGHTDTLLRYGDLSAGLGRYDEAAGYYERARASGSKSLQALFSMEEVMEKTQKWPDALGYVEAVLDIDPDNLHALYKKRLLFERQGKWDEIIDVQKAVIKQVHGGKERRREQAFLMGYRYELARDSFERGDLEKANKGMRAILREDKDFVPAYMGVAEVLLAGGDSEAAVGFIEGAFESTSSLVILARLEEMLITLGEPLRLIRTYRKAVSANPQDEMLKFFLGKLYFRLEMIEDALETLSALEATESYPQVHKLLGELYLRRDQCHKAVEQFRKALELERGLESPYSCSVCERSDEEWSGRCPQCGNWNTYKLEPHGLSAV